MITNFLAVTCCLYIFYKIEPLSTMINLDRYCVKRWLIGYFIVISLFCGCLFTIAYCAYGYTINIPSLFFLGALSLILAVYKDQIFKGVCSYENKHKA